MQTNKETCLFGRDVHTECVRSGVSRIYTTNVARMLQTKIFKEEYYGSTTQFNSNEL